MRGLKPHYFVKKGSGGVEQIQRVTRSSSKKIKGLAKWRSWHIQGQFPAPTIKVSETGGTIYISPITAHETCCF